MGKSGIKIRKFKLFTATVQPALMSRTGLSAILVNILFITEKPPRIDFTCSLC